MNSAYRQLWQVHVVWWFIKYANIEKTLKRVKKNYRYVIKTSYIMHTIEQRFYLNNGILIQDSILFKNMLDVNVKFTILTTARLKNFHDFKKDNCRSQSILFYSLHILRMHNYTATEYRIETYTKFRKYIKFLLNYCML